MSNPIVKVWESDGKLYGSTQLTGSSAISTTVYNLQRTPETILGYDFSSVVEGRELITQYLKGDKDAS